MEYVQVWIILLFYILQVYHVWNHWSGFVIKIIRSFEERIQERWNKSQEDYLYSDALYFLKESYENEEVGGWRIGQTNVGFDVDMEMQMKK